MIGARIGRVGLTSTFTLAFLAAFVIAGTLAGAAQGQTSGTWSATGSLNTPRTGHTATLLQNGDVLVVGGENTAATFLTSAELYNPATGRWTATGGTAVARIEHSATLLPNGEVLVAGGYLGLSASDQPVYTATAELYNPATGKWAATGSMSVARAGHGAVLLSNGLVLVEGGNNSTSSAGNTAELYNPATGKWTATGTMENFHLYALVALVDGRALAVDESGSSLTPGEIFTPSTGKWSLTADMYYSHTGVSAVVLTSGDVLIYGNKLPSYTSEFYTPATNLWAHANGNNGTGVEFGPMVLLENGEVLLGGGSTVYNGKSAPSARSALYNPATNGWKATGLMREAVSHTLTRLQTGQALAVGGSDGEIYTP